MAGQKRLVGFVEVSDYSKSVILSRSVHSNLSLLKEKGEIFLLLQHPRNKTGIKYKIFKNVCGLYKKFIHQGKITLRLKEPTHELRVQNDPVELKNFLLMVSKCHTSPSPVDLLVPREPKNMTTKPRNSSASITPENLGTDRNPSSVTSLKVTDIRMMLLPGSLERYGNLKKLEISRCASWNFYKYFFDMPYLTELILPGNKLGKRSNWEFLSYYSLHHRLTLLDLSDNMISELPCQIANLQALQVLKLDDNMILTLPSSVGRMMNLRSISLCNNRLKSLPKTLTLLRGLHLDLSFNPGPEARPMYMLKKPDLKLKELCSQAIYKNRVSYYFQNLPACLVQYLESVIFCDVCGIPLFENINTIFQRWMLRHIFQSVMSDKLEMDFHIFLCLNCAVKNMRFFPQSQ